MKIYMQFFSGIGPMARSFPIAKYLKECGHDVRFHGIGVDKFVIEKFISSGIHMLTNDFDIKFIRSIKPYSNWDSIEEMHEIIGYNDFQWINNTVNKLKDQIVAFSPDVIISDCTILSSIVSRLLDIPHVAITQSCTHPNMLHGRMRWWDTPNNKEHKLIQIINAILQNEKKDQIEKFEELFTGNATIIPSYPDFDPLVNINEYNTYYVGAMLYDEKVSNEEEFVNLFSNKYNIFCYTGRLFDHVGESGFRILKSVIASLRDIDNTNLIISVGSEKDKQLALEWFNKYEDSVSARITIVSYIPMNIAYKYSNFIIHHGGHGSCLGQFLYGIPSLIIPTHTEREYNARISHSLGSSLILTQDQLYSNNFDLEENIYELINNDIYRNKTKYWGDCFKAYNYKGAEDVVKIIEKLF